MNFYEVPRRVEFIEAESKIVVTRNCGWGEGGVSV